MRSPSTLTDELQRRHWVTPQWAKARAAASGDHVASFIYRTGLPHNGLIAIKRHMTISNMVSHKTGSQRWRSPNTLTDELQRRHWVTPQWAKARAVVSGDRGAASIPHWVTPQWEHACPHDSGDHDEQIRMLTCRRLQRRHWVTPQRAKARAADNVAALNASYTALGYTAMG